MACASPKTQFDTAQNMTDRLAGLGALSTVDCPERTEALAAFHAAWHDDALVLDKWFAIQAGSPLPEHAGGRSAALQRHPDFDARNPNRIRALVGAFAANQVRFHDVSGAGYEFLPTPSSGSTPAIRRSLPGSSHRSGNGAGSTLSGRR